jgi:hypothetical protein
MAFYRIYQLRGPKNEVESFDEFEADNDESALARAEEHRGLNAMELWSGHRKVQRWEAIAPAPAHEL